MTPFSVPWLQPVFAGVAAGSALLPTGPGSRESLSLDTGTSSETSNVGPRALNYIWAAVGDSFSAGPGAGEKWGNRPDRCSQRSGAYPVQLSNDFPFFDSTMEFMSCTGDVTEDLINNQLSQLTSDYQLMTVSIGGNDLGFSSLLKDCIFLPRDSTGEGCSRAQEWTQNKIDNELEEKLFLAYDAIFDLLGDERQKVVFVQLYPSFFRADSQHCNGRTMSVHPTRRPRLTTELRQQLNGLTDSVRDKMKQIIHTYTEAQDWEYPRLFYSDEYGAFYDGHHFCEPWIESFRDPDIWFFTPFASDATIESDSMAESTLANSTTSVNVSTSTTEPSEDERVDASVIMERYNAETCADDPRYESDLVFNYGCDISRAYTEFNGMNGTLQARQVTGQLVASPDALVKAFHPKTAGYTKVKDELKYAMQRLAWPKQFYSGPGQGLVQCFPQRSRQVQDPAFYMTRERAFEEMEAFCSNRRNGEFDAGRRNVHHRNGVFQSYEVDHNTADCPTMEDPVGQCRNAMIHLIDDCDPVHNDPNDPNWKQGGHFYRDCVTWTIGLQDWPRSDLSLSADDPNNFVT